jgi:hypothetical protein
MQAYPFALNGRPNCLFKWQVILGKQITPAGTKVSVVFSPQIVALPSKYRYLAIYWAALRIIGQVVFCLLPA